MIKATKWMTIAGIAGIMTFFTTGCDLGDGSSSSELAAKIEEEARQIEEANQAEEARQAEERDAQERSSSSSSSSSSTGGGSGGFLWKPVSEGDGKLVILLPGSLRGRVSGCSISGSFGSENGRFTGDTHNGNRPHYRFSRPGASYGSNITVTARTTDGTRTWRIPNGASRNEQ